VQTADSIIVVGALFPQYSLLQTLERAAPPQRTRSASEDGGERTTANRIVHIAAWPSARVRTFAAAGSPGALALWGPRARSGAGGRHCRRRDNRL